MTTPLPPSGALEGAVHRFPVRVYFEDTDLSGMAYHANYLRWFERARSDMLRLLGIDQRSAHESGEGVYAVADLAIRYVAPARLDDVLTIETTALELRAASVRLLQRALRQDQLVAEMTVRVGFIAPNGRPRRQPDAWRATFTRLIPEESPA
ncbi:MAG TPA: YbgC/FadM family acyl-CoA thioesterase [Croceibacterium sp.]|nr:YbgC/FadM family acyl-CoA thioesterase [Croceibacterium sp.]